MNPCEWVVWVALDGGVMQSYPHLCKRFRLTTKVPYYPPPIPHAGGPEIPPCMWMWKSPGRLYMTECMGFSVFTNGHLPNHTTYKCLINPMGPRRRYRMQCITKLLQFGLNTLYGGLPHNGALVVGTDRIPPTYMGHDGKPQGAITGVWPCVVFVAFLYDVDFQLQADGAFCVNLLLFLLSVPLSRCDFFAELPVSNPFTLGHG